MQMRSILVPLVVGMTLAIPPRPTQAAQPEIQPQSQAQPQAQQYQLLGVTFTTPLPFSSPTAITDGVAVVYPAAAAPGEHDLLVGIIEIPGMDSVLANLSSAELMHWLRHSLDLAPASSAATPIQRVLFGRRLQGEALVKDPQNPMYQEVYVVRLSSGSRLAIKLEAAHHVPLPDVESVFSTVATSFAELPPRSRAWRQSMQWWKQPNVPAPSGINRLR